MNIQANYLLVGPNALWPTQPKFLVKCKTFIFVNWNRPIYL